MGFRMSFLGSLRVFLSGVLLCVCNLTTMGSELPIVLNQASSLGKPFVVPSNVPWVETSIRLTKGKRYRISAQESACYKDDVVPCTADGARGLLGWSFDRCVRSPGRLNLFRYVGPGVTKRLRVLKDESEERRRASFLTLIATIGMDDSKASTRVIGRCREFDAVESGTLFLFCNDWPGGIGTQGENRFRNPAKSGAKSLPTYGNNHGHLSVTVEEITPPR